MRTNEERIAAMYQRAAEIQKQSRTRTAWIARSLSVAACFAIMILMAVFLPNATNKIATQPLYGNMSASMFANNSVLGFIVIAIIAFLLGVGVTIFSYRLKRWQDGKDPKDRK